MLAAFATWSEDTGAGHTPGILVRPGYRRQSLPRLLRAMGSRSVGFRWKQVWI